jgi:predicted nucleic acid-binding protein
MSGYLLDTSVLSTFAPDRPPIPKLLQDWIVEQGRREMLFMPSIVIMEIQRGIAKLRRSGAIERPQRLERWLDLLLTEFGQRIINLDIAVAREAGRLEDAAIARGRHPGVADVLIAATARSHGLQVLTTNLKHFSGLDVPHFNPLVGDLP